MVALNKRHTFVPRGRCTQATSPNVTFERPFNTGANKKKNSFNCLSSSLKMLFLACILPSFCSTSDKKHQLARNELHRHGSLQAMKCFSPCSAPLSKSRHFVEVGNSAISLLKTSQMGKSSNFIRKPCNPSSPRLPVRSFLPSWNSHQLSGSADRLKISPPITAHVGVENKGKGEKKK